MSAEIIVIGGGPAGMMAAIKAGLLGRQVILVEKGLGLGRKLCLSGKGRGNLTNTADIDRFLESFNPAGRFLHNAFSRFFNRELIEFFEKQGRVLKTEKQGRVFPQSARSKDILAVLQKCLARAKVDIICNRAVREILLNACRIYLEANRTKLIILTIEDVSERKKIDELREKVRELEAKLKKNR